MGAGGIECLLVADAEAYHAWIAQVHIFYLLKVGLLPGVEVFLGTGGGGTGHQIDEAVGVGVYFADAGSLVSGVMSMMTRMSYFEAMAL